MRLWSARNAVSFARVERKRREVGGERGMVVEKSRSRPREGEGEGEEEEEGEREGERGGVGVPPLCIHDPLMSNLLIGVPGMTLSMRTIERGGTEEDQEI